MVDFIVELCTTVIMVIIAGYIVLSSVINRLSCMHMYRGNLLKIGGTSTWFTFLLLLRSSWSYHFQ